jgi:hypothetical protein
LTKTFQNSQQGCQLITRGSWRLLKDDDDYDEDYKDRSSSHDALLRKIGMLCQRCVENERIIKKLKMELRLSKSHARQTKRQIRIDYDWDGKEANFADLVLSFVKEYLFPLF